MKKPFISKAEQQRATILLALKIKGELKREEVIKDIEDEGFIAMDENYNSKSRSNSFRGPKRLHWEIQELLHKEEAIIRTERGYYKLSSLGEIELSEIAQKIFEYRNNGGEKFILTEKCIHEFEKYLKDISQKECEQAAERIRKLSSSSVL